jgi:hypothetical protein
MKQKGVITVFSKACNWTALRNFILSKMIFQTTSLQEKLLRVTKAKYVEMGRESSMHGKYEACMTVCH